MTEITRSRFPELLQIKLPAGVNKALDRLATAQHRTKSEVVRRAVLDEIAAHGLPITAVAPPEVPA